MTHTFATCADCSVTRKKATCPSMAPSSRFTLKSLSINKKFHVIIAVHLMTTFLLNHDPTG